VTNTPGFENFSGQRKDMNLQGHGKYWLTDGRVFIGEWHESVMKEGTLYELEPNGVTYTTYQVKYDF
jgi:hypothetical protein